MFEDKDLEYLEGYKEGMIAGVDIVIKCLKETVPKAINNLETDLKMRLIPPAEGGHLN